MSGISFILGPGKKISKKLEKKLKNLFPELFLAKTGVDRVKKREKKREKIILPRFPFLLGLGRKIPKKILVLNSVRTQPE